MKMYFLLLCFLPLLCFAQKTETRFFDINWKSCEAGKARYAALIKKTDSGWLRNDYYLSNNNLQMAGLFADSACEIENGWFRYYYPGGNISSYGRYVQGKKQGLWLGYHNNGMMKDSSFYENDHTRGISLSWHSNGYLADSVYTQEDGYAVNTGWFSNGNPSYAGRSLLKKREGVWQFFHVNGQLAAKETYLHDKITDSSYFDEEGRPLPKKLYENSYAVFKGGNKAWRKYLEKKLVFPTGYQLVNTDEIVVVVEAIIDEDGNVADAWVDIPFKPPFDDEALQAFKRSPRWQPCTLNNRRVMQIIRQPVTFSQVDD